MSDPRPAETRKRARRWRPAARPDATPADAVRDERAGVGAEVEPSPDASASALSLLRDLSQGKAPRSDDAKGLWSAIKDVARAAKDRVSEEFDTDRALMHAMSGVIEAAGSRYALDAGAQWEPGAPLKLLLAGYNGTRNTGADVRVEEMIRQFRHLFGDEHVEMSIFTIDPEKTKGYFRTVRQLHIPKIFPRYLAGAVHDHHAVVACEGSMFKSKFASALSTMMVGAIGLAAAEQKLAIGYGGEAGKMDKGLAKLVERYCRDGLILARNQESQEILGDLGVPAKGGTDTAWAFTPAPPSVGEAILRERGWDGETPVLALCPINPFWWPVKPNLTRAATNALGGLHADEHYGSVYFHREGKDVHDAQERYLDAWAEGVRHFRNGHDIFPVCFGSEMLDREACEGLSERLADERGAPPIIVSDEFDMYEMVSAMRVSRYLLSSRYHAIVTTMGAPVASAGITMDERIRNLMKDRGTPELALEVDDPELGARVAVALEALANDRERIEAGIDRCVVANLLRMGEMGLELVEFVRERHPEFPFAAHLGRGRDPLDHLPSLPPRLADLVAAHRSSPEGARS